MLYTGLIYSYEAIMKSGSDYGRIGNFLILNLTEIIQYPASLFISSNSNSYFLRILINLCIQSGVIYLALKYIFKKLSN